LRRCWCLRSSERSTGLAVVDTGAILTVEEGTGGWSWGTEVAVRVRSRMFGHVRRAPAVVASARDVIPSAPNRDADVLVRRPTARDRRAEAAG